MFCHATPRGGDLVADPDLTFAWEPCDAAPLATSSFISPSSYNVSSWLVARVAIVAIFQIILKLMYCLEGLLLWQNKIGRALFFEKKNCNYWEAFFLKNAVAQSSFCSSLYLSL